MTTISYYTGSEFIEETLTANEVAALKVIPEYAIIFGESDIETVETETAEIETATGSDIETAEIENVTGAETETVEMAVEVEVAGGVYVNANATELDKYIAIYRQGDIIMKRGAALKMVALALTLMIIALLTVPVMINTTKISDFNRYAYTAVHSNGK